jgi:threonine dehydrogenase-like Zn-dependent dehydrogenase
MTMQDQPTDIETTAHLLDAYKHAALPLPERYRRWHLYGAGLENVGREGQPEAVPLPHPGPDQILVRHDACGICYSDIKIINLGGEHPRLVGRELSREPVVMGHEVALTVVEAGQNYKDRFTPGQRFIVQADVYYQGRNLAYGYALTGGMSQYGLVGPELLEGDEGCYLLPIAEGTNYAEGALVEPWACVEAAYLWAERFEPKAGGKALLVTSEKVVLTPGSPWTTRRDSRSGDQGLAEDERYDDIRFDETPDAEVFEHVCAHLAKGGVAHLNFSGPLERPVKVDVGRIHYDGHMYVGPKPNGRNEIKGGGTAWFVGAAGPMGQMHVQRALQLPHPPARLICTDRNAARITALRERYLPLAKERGVELLNFNVKEDGPPPFDQIAPNGFDDIVVMVPDVQAIEEAFPRLAENGVLNVFAGLARGTMAALDISLIATKNVRIVGTSGSTIHDMVTTRDKMERGDLDTGASLAAVGGLEAFRDGLEAVKAGRFPGKTVIYPHVRDLPLTALPELKEVRPNVYAKLRDGKFWTDEAEEELLREALGAGGGGDG